MNVVLVFPPITVEDRYGKSVRNVGGVLPPLGLAYIASFLEAHDHCVNIIDGQASMMSMEQLAEQVSGMKPDVVGLSALTPTIHRANQAATAIRKKCPEINIVMGGHHPSLFPTETITRNQDVDIVCIGEGEHTMLELTRALESNEGLSEVRGIAFRDGNKIRQNSPREFIEDLDSLPFPARHLLPMKAYRPLPNQWKRLPVVHMMASRGCPYRCTYCSKSVFGRTYRTRSPQNVIEEINLVIKKYGAKEVEFWDDTFTMNRSWVHALCDLMIKEGLDIVWTCETRVDRVDLDTLRTMEKAGCWKISYGIESGCQDLLDTIKKDITLEQIRNAVKWTKNAEIEAGLSFMLALPRETPEDALKTIRLAVELDPEYAQFCITTPYPGTELFSQAQCYGNLSCNFSGFTIWNPVFVPHGYEDAKKILEVQKRAFRAFYCRPMYFLKRISKIRSLTDLKRNIDGLKVVLSFS